MLSKLQNMFKNPSISVIYLVGSNSDSFFEYFARHALHFPCNLQINFLNLCQKFCKNVAHSFLSKHFFFIKNSRRTKKQRRRATNLTRKDTLVFATWCRKQTHLFPGSMKKQSSILSSSIEFEHFSSLTFCKVDSLKP